MSIRLNYNDREVTPHPQESVLDALLRVGIDVPFSCKGGSCHTCLMQCVEGSIPAKAQRGLPEHLARLHYFLPCQCQATEDMQLRAPQPDDLVTPCMLCEAAGHDTGKVHVIFEPQTTLRYRQGQTLRVVTPDGQEPEILITSDPDKDLVMQGELRLAADGQLPVGFGPDAEFGFEFQVPAPTTAAPRRNCPRPPSTPSCGPNWARAPRCAP